jgi:hypothetical protein
MKYFLLPIFGSLVFILAFSVFTPSFASAQATGESKDVCGKLVQNKPVVEFAVNNTCPTGNITRVLVVDGKVCVRTTTGGLTITDLDPTTKKCKVNNATVVTVQQAGSSTGTGTGTGGGGNTKPPTASTVDFNEPIGTLDNPLGVDNLVDFSLRATRILLSLVAIAATVVIVISGFRMVIANGNTKTIGDAKTAITYAVIGLIVALMSFSIVAILQNLIQSRL